MLLSFKFPVTIFCPVKISGVRLLFLALFMFADNNRFRSGARNALGHYSITRLSQCCTPKSWKSFQSIEKMDQGMH